MFHTMSQKQANFIF